MLERVIDVHGLKIDVSEDLLHGAAYDKYGTFCRAETLQVALQADAVLVGAVGGPKWDEIDVPGGPEEQDGLMLLRQKMEVYAGLRPSRAFDPLVGLTPYRAELVTGADVMVVRELCGGVYFGIPRGMETLADGSRRGYDTTSYTTSEVERIARVAFELARRRRGELMSADKANVMVSSVLWRDVVTRIGAQTYPDVKLTHLYADNASFQLARDPLAYDVVLADNLFGDMLSDQIAVYAGSLGMLPSASLSRLAPVGERSPGGIYEPVHGTAPDIAGLGIANPIGTILSVAMMFEYGFGMSDIARRIESAVDTALADGHRTPDIGGNDTTDQITQAVVAAYQAG